MTHSLLQPKRALITGVTGQDGSLLARFLLNKGYDVHGLRLYSATEDTQRLSNLTEYSNFTLHTGDMTDSGSLWNLLSNIKPDEIYNLAAQSHVQVSFQTPESTANINALGTLRLLEAIKGLGLIKTVRFYQASSSEMFGNAPAPQNEDTVFMPCSPYGAAKLYAYHLVRQYREAYGLHASNGILFNHESPVRGEEFVTRKITKAVAAIDAGIQDCLMIGNLDARRDWGDARDYVRGMWLMLQQDMPGDYVLATGESHSVRDFIEQAFSVIGISLEWRGEGVNEKAYNPQTQNCVVAVDPQFFRPAELHELIGDASRARFRLKWKPEYSFTQLITDMIETDRDALRNNDEAVYDDFSVA